MSNPEAIFSLDDLGKAQDGQVVYSASARVLLLLKNRQMRPESIPTPRFRSLSEQTLVK